MEVFEQAAAIKELVISLRRLSGKHLEAKNEIKRLGKDSYALEDLKKARKNITDQIKALSDKEHNERMEDDPEYAAAYEQESKTKSEMRKVYADLLGIFKKVSQKDFEECVVSVLGVNYQLVAQKKMELFINGKKPV